MKILLTGIAATLMATGAMAQMSTPSNPSGSMSTPSTTTPPADPMTSPDATMAPGTTGSTPTDSMGTTGTTTESAMLTERDGKWYNGDRRATRDEIAAYKRAKKAGRPS